MSGEVEGLLKPLDAETIQRLLKIPRAQAATVAMAMRALTAERDALAVRLTEAEAVRAAALALMDAHWARRMLKGWMGGSPSEWSENMALLEGAVTARMDDLRAALGWTKPPTGEANVAMVRATLEAARAAALGDSHER